MRPQLSSWRVAGTYVEACNCEAVCPCRAVGGVKGGRSTYETCDFALSWQILEGYADDLDLSGFGVVLAGSYADDEPGSPWRVSLYLDERAPTPEQDALETIFLGRAGGTSFDNFGRLIDLVYAVRPAAIELEHTRGRERFRAGQFVRVEGFRSVDAGSTVSCGIPGHDHPGTEMVTDLQLVDDGSLRWEVRGRCGFATDFDYVGDADQPLV